MMAAIVRVTVQVSPPSIAAAVRVNAAASVSVGGAVCAPLVHAIGPGRPAVKGFCLGFALDDRAGRQAGESSGSALVEVVQQGWGGQGRTLHFYWG